MRQYWVIGGEYESTTFKRIADGKQETREGPFDNYDAALKVWQTLAWQTVDNALAHFHIEEEELAGADGKPTHWVVGGSFTDTTFQNWATPPERHGPFATYEEAEKKWQELAWQTVDDATAMYRIETLRAEQETAKPKKAYKLLTGEDSSAFCQKVSDALGDGYALYGSPCLTVAPDGTRYCAQAVVLQAEG